MLMNFHMAYVQYAITTLVSLNRLSVMLKYNTFEPVSGKTDIEKKLEKLGVSALAEVHLDRYRFDLLHSVIEYQGYLDS